jgi:hypothetical protein
MRIFFMHKNCDRDVGLLNVSIFACKITFCKFCFSLERGCRFDQLLVPADLI